MLRFFNFFFFHTYFLFSWMYMLIHLNIKLSWKLFLIDYKWQNKTKQVAIKIFVMVINSLPLLFSDKFVIIISIWSNGIRNSKKTIQCISFCFAWLSYWTYLNCHKETVFKKNSLPNFGLRLEIQKTCQQLREIRK